MEKHYVINLPERFPEELITNLSGVRYANWDMIKKLYNAYEKIPKENSTYAASPKDALGHLFFRTLENKLAKTFLKMFKSNAKKYAFDLQPLAIKDLNEESLSLSQAKTFRTMELALDISRVQGGKPDYFKANRLISKCGKNFQ